MGDWRGNVALLDCAERLREILVPLARQGRCTTRGGSGRLKDLSETIRNRSTDTWVDSLNNSHELNSVLIAPS